MKLVNSIITASLLLVLSCQTEKESQLDRYSVKYFSKNEDSDMNSLKGKNTC